VPEPVRLTVPADEGQNRLWGIPFFGIWVRAIPVIPHFIVLWLLGISVGLLVLVSWIPVLLDGRQSDRIGSFAGGYYRWAARTRSYALLLTGTYPPFGFGD
jgi:hypothetical protein